jgi:hypothetical protein
MSMVYQWDEDLANLKKEVLKTSSTLVPMQKNPI